MKSNTLVVEKKRDKMPEGSESRNHTKKIFFSSIIMSKSHV